MTEDRRTKAQLLEEIKKLSEIRDYHEANRAERPAEIPEADALRDCIRALNKLPLLRSVGTSYIWMTSGAVKTDQDTRDRAQIARILEHLKSLYGVS